MPAPYTLSAIKKEKYKILPFINKDNKVKVIKVKVTLPIIFDSGINTDFFKIFLLKSNINKSLNIRNIPNHNGK